jgi:hypothetical protein
MKTDFQANNATNEQDLTHDPVWDLLRQSPATPVSVGFADRVLAAARNTPQRSPFWSRGVAVLSAVSAMAAALVIAAVIHFLPQQGETTIVQSPQSADAFASLDEVANQEVLLAATDHLGDFSQTELVSLIGL